MAYRRPPMDVDRMTSLRVGNLPYNTNMEDLQPLFEKFGELGDVYLPTERGTGRSRGFAFVRFLDKDDAMECMDQLNGRTYDGRELRISLDAGRPGVDRPSREDYRPRYSRSRSRSGGRRRRSRSGGRRRSRSGSRERSRRDRERSGSRGRKDRKDRSVSRSRSKSKSKSNSKSKRKRSRSKSKKSKSPSKSQSR